MFRERWRGEIDAARRPHAGLERRQIDGHEAEIGRGALEEDEPVVGDLGEDRP